MVDGATAGNRSGWQQKIEEKQQQQQEEINGSNRSEATGTCDVRATGEATTGRGRTGWD